MHGMACSVDDGHGVLRPRYLVEQRLGLRKLCSGLVGQRRPLDFACRMAWVRTYIRDLGPIGDLGLQDGSEVTAAHLGFCYRQNPDSDVALDFCGRSFKLGTSATGGSHHRASGCHRSSTC